MLRRLSVLALVLVAPAGCRSSASSDTSASTPTASAAAMSPQDAVARVDGQAITLADVDKKVADKIYEARRAAIEQAIADKLVENEAKKRNLTVDALFQAEVDAKVVPPTPQDVETLYEQNKFRFTTVTKAEALPQIQHVVEQRARTAAEQRFRQALRARSTVQVVLQPPRIAIAVAADAPSLGPAKAPVTVIEFLDYQCPYCQRAQLAVDEMMKRYDGKVRFVHRDFPLDGHARAFPTARAARCAGDQGKFWPYHHDLLANPSDFSDADLKKRAQTAGLDGAAFATCLASDRHDADIRKSQAEGDKVEVQATPTFFVNGKKLMGARDAEQFAELIDPELNPTRQ